MEVYCTSHSNFTVVIPRESSSPLHERTPKHTLAKAQASFLGLKE